MGTIDLEKMHSINWWHRIRLAPDIITPGIVLHGPDDGDWPTSRFGLPEDLTGKSVLDAGCWDGFFSFEAERRGAARVVAIDVPAGKGGNPFGRAGFDFAKGVLRSRVEFIEMGVYDAPSLGEFDLVLCFGVLYHLIDVLGAIRSLSGAVAHGGSCLIETAISAGQGCYLEYLPGLDNDPTNFFYPTIPCLFKMCTESGFVQPSLLYSCGIRATVRAPMAG